MRKMIFAVSHSTDSELLSFGLDGGLPWPKNPSDMRFFRKYTTNQLLVCGSHTKLPEEVYTTLGRRLYSGRDLPKDCCVIGGATLINKYWKYMDEITVNMIGGIYSADTFIDTSLLDEFNAYYPTKIIRTLDTNILQFIWSVA